MLRKAILALIFVLTLGATAVQAVQGDLLSADILITLRDGERIIGDGTVELCRAGDLTDGGFLLEKEFGGGFIAQEEVPSPDFARWMSGRADLGLIYTVDDLGTARYTGMEPGLYLVRQREASEGYEPFRPYLVAVTGDMTLVDTYPVMKPREGNPRTRESPEPWLAALAAAATLAGCLFWDQARRETDRELR